MRQVGNKGIPENGAGVASSAGRGATPAKYEGTGIDGAEREREEFALRRGAVSDAEYKEKDTQCDGGDESRCNGY